jgi:hypothetical protein
LGRCRLFGGMRIEAGGLFHLKVVFFRRHAAGLAR